MKVIFLYRNPLLPNKTRSVKILQSMPAINIEMTKHKNENAASLLRRFTRQIRNSGILRELKDRRYYERQPSTLRKKRSALARLESTKKYAKLKKLGKVA